MTVSASCDTEFGSVLQRRPGMASLDATVMGRTYDVQTCGKVSFPTLEPLCGSMSALAADSRLPLFARMVIASVRNIVSWASQILSNTWLPVEAHLLMTCFCSEEGRTRSYRLAEDRLLRHLEGRVRLAGPQRKLAATVTPAA